MDKENLDFDFAKAWDLNQGSFAKEIAENLLSFGPQNNKKFDTILDIGCGASNLIGVFESQGKKCFGTETRQGMYDYSKQKHPDATYYLTKSISEIPGKAKVDLITCTHDMINYLESFDEWIKLFKSANKHLNKNGVFFFDFYTKNKLQNWNETKFSSSEYLDFVMTVKSGLYDKTSLSYSYYINYQDHVIKTKSIAVECYFDNEKIFDALKKCGFKNLQIVNSNLDPVASYDNAERIYVLASRK